MSHPSDPATSQSASEIGLILIEDHPAVRKGLELLFRNEGHRVLGSADDAAAGLAMVRRRNPDAVVLDLGLGGNDGVELVAELLADDPLRGVVIYTGVEDERVLARAFASGARGFVTKRALPQELLEAIGVVARGGSYVDTRLSALLLSHEAEPGSPLTNREQEILGLLAEGLTGEAIARRLFLSRETVRTHVRNSVEKLGAHTRVQAIAIALERGLLPLTNDRGPVGQTPRSGGQPGKLR